MSPLFQTVQLLYWLSLSTWFGSALFVMLAAPVVFRTVKENNPILSHVLSVNMDGQHSTLLAGSIMYNLISRFMQVQLVCAPTVLITLVMQMLLVDLGNGRLAPAAFRLGLYLISIGVAFYDWQIVWPKIRASRQEYIDHADEPEIANVARDKFDREQRVSLNLLSLVIMLLAGMILFSSGQNAFVMELMQKAK
jgi:hypothetical protein